MSTTVTGSPADAFAAAVYQRLDGDAQLATLVTGVFQTIRRDQTQPYPYVVLSRSEVAGPQSAGAMQREGGTVLVVVDVWSDKNDPSVVRAIQSRIRALLQRTDLAVQGFTLYGGSVVCEHELVIPDFDTEMPQSMSLFHGVQHWTGALEEAA